MPKNYYSWDFNFIKGEIPQKFSVSSDFLRNLLQIRFAGSRALCTSGVASDMWRHTLLLISVDENENQPRELKCRTDINFSLYIKKYSYIFPVSCHQLLKAVKSWFHLITFDDNENEPR